MDDQRIKSLDELSDESEQFEDRFLKLEEVKDDSANRQLIADIASWLQNCAQQGKFISTTSADRRALRSMMERWKSRLRVHGGLSEEIDSLSDFDPNAGIVLKGDCPYPGLEPYGENRCGSFFGRDALVSDCIQHLEQQGNRILLLIGASGSGKSSVALAGVLPQLKKNHHETWLFSPTLTPGANPLAALASSVANVTDYSDQTTKIEEALTTEPDKALDQLAKLCGDKPLMLLIDQFEELFTQCHDEKIQSTFAKVLCSLSDPTACGSSFSCRILLTLRTDQQARFENSKALKSLHDRLIDEKNEHFRYLSTIGFEHIKHAIKKPADKIGLRFIPPSLIDQLASQTAGLTNGLPLLQFSLQHLWKNRAKNESGEPLDLVTEAMIQKLPDVERALGEVADNIFQGFSAEQKKICERLLLELMVLDEGFEEPLRRRRNEMELKQVLSSLPAPPGDTIEVINTFVEERLIRRFGDETDSQIEVAHEALLRHWGHIYNLLMEGEVKERLHLIKKIKAEALDWKSHPDNQNDYLNLKGERLDRARTYAEDKWLAEEETAAYVDACMEEAKQEKKAKWQKLALMWGAVFIAFVSLVVSWSNKIYKDVEIANQKTELIRENAKLASLIADLVGKGHYYLQLDKPYIAKDNFLKAHELAGKDSKAARAGLGLIYLRGDAENINKATVHFQYLIDHTKDKEEDSALHTYHFYKGVSLQSAGKHEKAITEFEKATKLQEQVGLKKTSPANYYYQWGLSYYALKDMKKAQVAFDKATKLQEKSNPPNNVLADYYYNLGRSYNDLKDIKKAEETFKKAISFRQKMEIANSKAGVPAHDTLGTMYLQQGETKKTQKLPRQAAEQFEKAEEEFKKAIYLAGKNYNDMLTLKVKLGNALSAQNKQEGAIKVYSEAQDINSKDASVALYLTDAYIKNKECENAESHLIIVKKLAKSDPKLQTNVEKQGEVENKYLDFFKNKLKEIEEDLEKCAPEENA